MRCAAISLHAAICIKHPHNVIGTHANTSKKKRRCSGFTAAVALGSRQTARSSLKSKQGNMSEQMSAVAGVISPDNVFLDPRHLFLWPHYTQVICDVKSLTGQASGLKYSIINYRDIRWIIICQVFLLKAWRFNISTVGRSPDPSVTMQKPAGQIQHIVFSCILVKHG